MNQTSDQECPALAYYGIRPSAQKLEWFFQSVVKWLTDLGCSIDKLSVHGTGCKGKIQSFSRLSPKLKKSGFAGVTGVSIISMLPGGVFPTSDYKVTAFCSATDKYAVIAKSTPEPLDSMLPIAKVLVDVLKPTYGIGYTREHRFGPSFYAIGICQGIPTETDEEYEQALTIGRWGDIAMSEEEVYREGILRDVYPLNFLTEPQLNRDIKGEPLKQWIKASGKRGQLCEFTENVELWTVPEKHQPAIRRALWEAGAIFNWRDYLEED